MKRIYLFFTFILIFSCKTSDAFSLRKMNENERFIFISTKVQMNDGVDLGNIIYHIKESKIDLRPYNKILMDKLKNAKYPYDINLLTETLIENQYNKPEIERILNSKIQIWDTGNWSEKLWSLINSSNLDIKKPNYYNLENHSRKKYNVSEFMKTHIINNELGENPLLMVNWKIVSYEEGKLIETLNKLDIKQIDYTSKNQSVSLYGKRGVDGLLEIITN